MKRTVAYVVLAGVGLAAPVSIGSLDSLAQGAAPPAAAQPASEPELFDHMLEVKRLVRDLARLAADPAKKQEALPLVAELQQHVVAAKDLAPPSAESKPEAERAAFLLQFRKAMAELLREVADLELDIIEDRNEEAVKRITGTIIEMRDKAHEVFQTD